MIQNLNKQFQNHQLNFPFSPSEAPQKVMKGSEGPFTVFLVGLSSDFNSAMLKDHFVANLGYTSVVQVKMPSLKADVPRGVK
jgi:hypothetical protein